MPVRVRPRVPFLIIISRIIMFIQIEETPNPNALKFLPGLEISPEGPIFLNSFEEAVQRSSLAVKIFQVGNVEAVFYGKEFITVTKSEQSEWSVLKPEILMVVMDHLVAGLPVFDQTQNIFKDIDKKIAW